MASYTSEKQQVSTPTEWSNIYQQRFIEHALPLDRVQCVLIGLSLKQRFV